MSQDDADRRTSGKSGYRGDRRRDDARGDRGKGPKRDYKGAPRDGRRDDSRGGRREGQGHGQDRRDGQRRDAHPRNYDNKGKGDRPKGDRPHDKPHGDRPQGRDRRYDGKRDNQHGQRRDYRRDDRAPRGKEEQRPREQAGVRLTIPSTPEKILFKDIYHKLEKAIKEQKKVYLSTRFNSGKRNLISPYAFAVVQEETFNYLLCKEENYCHSFRLSKIKDVIIRDERTDFSEKDLLLFERMKKYGPQYSYQSDESEAEIILTPKGQKYFRNLYVYRPIVDRIEEDHYFFHCSLDQLEQYFSRFGSECYIVKPLRLRRYLIRFYKKAYEIYRPQKCTEKDDFRNT